MLSAELMPPILAFTVIFSTHRNAQRKHAACCYACNVVCLSTSVPNFSSFESSASTLQLTRSKIICLQHLPPSVFIHLLQAVLGVSWRLQFIPSLKLPAALCWWAKNYNNNNNNCNNNNNNNNNAQGIHGSVCKQAPSKIARHQAINDVIARAITAAGVPLTKEPVGLVRIDGKRPDGLTLIPWQGGKAANLWRRM